MILLEKHNDVQRKYVLDYLHKAQLTGANPVLNQIYLVKYGTEPQTVFSYHYMMNLANQTGELGSINCDSKLEDVFMPERTIKNKVYPAGSIKEFVATSEIQRINKGITKSKALWSEYGKGAKGPIWQSKPHTMLQKCAIAIGLRRAFPEVMSAVFIEEEFHSRGVTEAKQIAHEVAPANDIVVEEKDPSDMDPNDYVVPMGQSEGKTLKELGIEGVSTLMKGITAWLDNREEGEPIDPRAIEMKTMATRFIALNTM
jgi:recombinational DNA repair protein RecT